MQLCANTRFEITNCAAQALRELQPLLQSPQAGLAAKAALIHASGVAVDHDTEIAVMKMATELDVNYIQTNSPACACAFVPIAPAHVVFKKIFSLLNASV